MSENGWMGDVQRGLALILVGTFALAVIVATGASIIYPDSTALVDMSKTLQAALVNMGLIALGFFFGSSQSKVQSDAGQQKIVDKLTSAPVAPVAPVVAPVLVSATHPVVVAWWSLLTHEEQSALEDSSSDVRIRTFIDAAKVGKATAADLSYIVGTGLLTQARADALVAS